MTKNKIPPFKLSTPVTNTKLWKEILTAQVNALKLKADSAAKDDLVKFGEANAYSNVLLIIEKM